ncbi:beta ketoadipyl CoA thiolase, th1 [Epichloe bromicola]|uniref:Beta ketoadipyl CoA thiolase, th1 n=1 Tax=Epichloe bromicola TaxID=79588 RepID=A0ABQ0CQL1_9HYPO
MHAFIITIIAMAGFAVAAPTLEVRGEVCSDVLYSVAQCCATNVLNVAALDCKTPQSANSVEEFKSACSGGKAMCCSIPAASLGVLCREA